MSAKGDLRRLEQRLARPRGRLRVEHVIVRVRAGGKMRPEDEARLAEARKRCAELEAAGAPTELVIVQERIVSPRERPEPAAPTTDSTLSGPATDSVLRPSSSEPAAGPTTTEPEPEPPEPTKPAGEYDEQLAKAQRGLSFGRWRW